MTTAPDIARITIRIGTAWFELAASRVHSIESFERLVAIPWPTRFLGLMPIRNQLVPVLQEEALGCTAGDRKRVITCMWQDVLIGVAAGEVLFSHAETALRETVERNADALDAALDRACAGLGPSELERGTGM